MTSSIKRRIKQLEAREPSRAAVKPCPEAVAALAAGLVGDPYQPEALQQHPELARLFDMEAKQ